MFYEQTEENIALIKMHLKKIKCRYIKETHTIKALNFELNLMTGTSYSYGWYLLSKKIGKTLITNDYKYSPTTGTHYYKLCQILKLLNLDKYETIKAPEGLYDLDRAINYYNELIKELQMKIDTPKSRASTNEDRKNEIESYLKKIELIQKLQKKESK